MLQLSKIYFYNFNWGKVKQNKAEESRSKKIIKLGSGISRNKKTKKFFKWSVKSKHDLPPKKYSRIEIRLINKINKTQILLGMKKTDLQL